MLRNFINFGAWFVNPAFIASIEVHRDAGRTQKVTIRLADGSERQFTGDEAAQVVEKLRPLLKGKTDDGGGAGEV